jgi:hypothetical protein
MLLRLLPWHHHQREVVLLLLVELPTLLLAWQQQAWLVDWQGLRNLSPGIHAHQSHPACEAATAAASLPTTASKQHYRP